MDIIRGGTDGAQMTERGLPTPNLSCGQHNPHSPLEWTSVEEMEQLRSWCNWRWRGGVNGWCNAELSRTLRVFGTMTALQLGVRYIHGGQSLGWQSHRGSPELVFGGPLIKAGIEWPPIIRCSTPPSLRRPRRGNTPGPGRKSIRSPLLPEYTSQAGTRTHSGQPASPPPETLVREVFRMPAMI